MSQKIKKNKGNRKKRTRNRKNINRKNIHRNNIRIPKELFPEFHFTLFNKNNEQNKISNAELGLFDNYTVPRKLKLLDKYLYDITIYAYNKEEKIKKNFSIKEQQKL